MFSSDACFIRNGQLKQLNDGRGMGKAKQFIQAKTLEKFMQTRMKTKKPPENPTHVYIPFFTKKVPLWLYLLSVLNGVPSTYHV